MMPTDNSVVKVPRSFLYDNDNGEWDVVCECGNNSFHLKYGQWELFAVCSQCGREKSVYQG